ncbi:MAG: acetoacetate decarboxylase family protein [Oryzihumus sp.]
MRFEVIRMPDSSGLGDYTESGQVLRVRHEGDEGDFIHSMYLDNAPAIALGREGSAYPKSWAARACSPTPTPSSGRWTTAACALSGWGCTTPTSPSRWP